MTGSHFDTAVFTNLTRDHLDYHVTMDAYAEAKAILFAWPGLRTAVVNVDDPYAGLMAETARKNGAAVWATTLTGVVPLRPTMSSRPRTSRPPRRARVS